VEVWLKTRSNSNLFGFPLGLPSSVTSVIVKQSSSSTGNCASRQITKKFENQGKVKMHLNATLVPFREFSSVERADAAKHANASLEVNNFVKQLPLAHFFSI